MDTIINVRHLCQKYGDRTLYEDLHFSVPSGKIFGLLGKNGVGKTTLIKILMGFLRPVSGKCSVFGEDSHALSPATRARIGLLFEGHLAYDFMTIEQIEQFYGPHYARWNRDVYYDLVDRLGLSHSHVIKNMSCGQRSQVVLGLIFAQQPDLMILDDYSMGLDAGYRRLFLEYLREYVRDGTKTVFMTSHVILDLEDMVDDVLFLERGGALLQTTLKDFTSQFKCFAYPYQQGSELPRPGGIIKNVEMFSKTVSLYSFGTREEVSKCLAEAGITAPSLERVPMNLEDAFVGYTGTY
ncbi:MAG: methyltransferase [Deltaproteobacteria bacterium]|nr:MAG: methyltransferase [Deltaproteobacteria bacterium]